MVVEGVYVGAGGFDFYGDVSTLYLFLLGLANWDVGWLCLLTSLSCW